MAHVSESARKNVVRTGLHKWIFPVLRGLEERLADLTSDLARDIQALSPVEVATAGGTSTFAPAKRKLRDNECERFLAFEETLIASIQVLHAVTLLANTKTRVRTLFTTGVFEPVHNILKFCGDKFHQLPSTPLFDTSLLIKIQIEAFQAALTLAHNEENLTRILATGGHETLEEAAENLKELAAQLVGHTGANPGSAKSSPESQYILDIENRINILLRQKNELTGCAIS